MDDIVGLLGIGETGQSRGVMHRSGWAVLKGSRGWATRGVVSTSSEVMGARGCGLDVATLSTGVGEAGYSKLGVKAG